MTFFATSIEMLNLFSLDKSTMAESRKQKFAHVYENGRDFSESLKKRLTSIKTIENLDTCTRTEPI